MNVFYLETWFTIQTWLMCICILGFIVFVCLTVFFAKHREYDIKDDTDPYGFCPWWFVCASLALLMGICASGFNSHAYGARQFACDAAELYHRGVRIEEACKNGDIGCSALRKQYVADSIWLTNHAKELGY
jgi:hypothetical protein